MEKFEYKGTPGPWTAKGSIVGVLPVQGENGEEWMASSWRIHKGDGGKEIGLITYCTAKGGYGYVDKISEAEANTHLIAAAPDLLEALIKAVDLIEQENEGYNEYHIPSWYSAAKVAIAKALNLQP